VSFFFHHNQVCYIKSHGGEEEKKKKKDYEMECKYYTLRNKSKLQPINTFIYYIPCYHLMRVLGKQPKRKHVSSLLFMSCVPSDYFSGHEALMFITHPQAAAYTSYQVLPLLIQQPGGMLLERHYVVRLK